MRNIKVPTPESVSLEINGKTLTGIRHRVKGEDAPTKALCLHGWLDNANSFLPMMPLLPEIDLLAIDMPGHGHSGPPADGAANVDRNALDLAAAIDTLAPDASAVVGMSLGGLTTLAMSQAFPELFSHMILVDITPGVNQEKADHIRRFVNGPSTFASFDELLARTMEFNPTRSQRSLRLRSRHPGRV